MGATIAAIAEAIKASGAIVRLEPSEFERVVARADEPLVVRSSTPGGALRRERHRYLFGYRGLVFYTTAKRQLDLPVRTEMIEAKQIWVPP